MVRVLCLLLAAAALAAPVEAQPGLYAGATGGARGGDLGGHIDFGVLSEAGGLVGWRFNDSWSAEIHVDRAFGDSNPRRFTELLYSGMTLTSEIYGQTVIEESAGGGFSAFAVWTSRPSGRVRGAVTMGWSARHIGRHRVTTVTSVGPDVNLPLDHPARQGRDERSDFRARGIAGGFLVPVSLGRGWTVAPEVRVSTGRIEDTFYLRQLYAGTRVMWGF